MKNYTTTGAAGVAALDPNTSYAKAYALIPPGSRVLDLGCGSGELASYLAARGDRVWGVDVNPAAVAAAAAFCAGTRVADLEGTELTALFPGLEFDVVVFADVLEHLREPWTVLQAARAVLAPGGRVVASIPNFGHAAVRLAVVSGTLPYRGLGILDDSHVRFFTFSGVESLFEESGFRLQEIARTSLPFGASSELVPDVKLLRVPDEIERHVRDDPEHETLQFIVRAVMLPGEWDMSALRGRLHDVEARLAEQTVGFRNLVREQDAARVRAGELAARVREFEAEAGRIRAAAAADADAARAAAEADAGAARAAAEDARAVLTAVNAERDAAAAREAEALRERDDAAAREAEALRERDDAAARAAEALRERDDARAAAAAAAQDVHRIDQELSDAKAALTETIELRDEARARLDEVQARLRALDTELAHGAETARQQAAELQHAVSAALSRAAATDEQIAAERARHAELESEFARSRARLESELVRSRDELAHGQDMLAAVRAETAERAAALDDARARIARAEMQTAEVREALRAATSELAELDARRRRAGLVWLAGEHDMLGELDDGAQFWRADEATR